MVTLRLTDETARAILDALNGDDGARNCVGATIEIARGKRLAEAEGHARALGKLSALLANAFQTPTQESQ